MIAPARGGLVKAGSVRGGPLVMLALLLAGWGAARVVLWDDPFAQLVPALKSPLTVPGGLARADPVTAPAGPPMAGNLAAPLPARLVPPADNGFAAADHLLALPVARAQSPKLASKQQREPQHEPIASAKAPVSGAVSAPVSALVSGPVTRVQPLQRWSLDAWAFWRQGSSAAPVSQGRVPVYGASQTGAVLQYRIAPGDAHDPRLYARAYRALVRQGESELALGASARPLGRVPLRVAAELRYTDGAFADTMRLAAYVVTEIAPLALPYGVQGEAYGQAGWVGGPNQTGFADGQASVTREVRGVAARSDNAVRLSVGAAAWGGAQKDAQRIDIGPTLRLDLTLGDSPARLSLDWRERVGGDAGPDSGLAATLSARF